LSGCPAGMLLLTSGAAFFFAASAAVAFRSGLAAGVNGSLKGWAADVDVAVGGVWEEVESPCRPADCVAVLAEIGVALRRRAVVVRKRMGCGRVEGVIWAREAARRQVRHIILGVCGVRFQFAFVDALVKSLRCEGMAAEVFRRFRVALDGILVGHPLGRTMHYTMHQRHVMFLSFMNRLRAHIAWS
jgi:hypothetical protein